MDIGRAKEPVGLGEPVFPSRLSATSEKRKNVDQKLNPGDDGQRENDKERRDGQKVIFW